MGKLGMILRGLNAIGLVTDFLIDGRRIGCLEGPRCTAGGWSLGPKLRPGGGFFGPQFFIIKKFRLRSI